MELIDYINFIKNRNKKNELDNWIDLQSLIDTYTRYFVSLATSIIKYDTVPAGFDAKALETLLLYSDVLLIRKDDSINVMPFPFQYGVEEYTNVPYYSRYAEAGYANPAFGSESGLVINDDCYIVHNTESSLRTLELIRKSATIMSHIDISIMCTTVNSRMTGVFTSSSAKQTEAILDYYKRLVNGTYGIIADETADKVFTEVTYVPFQQTHSTSIQELLIAKNNEMRTCLRHLGISMSKDKSQAILSDEVESEDAILAMSIDAIRESRDLMCDKIREWGFEIEYHINEHLNLYTADNTNSVDARDDSIDDYRQLDGLAGEETYTEADKAEPESEYVEEVLEDIEEVLEDIENTLEDVEEGDEDGEEESVD